MKGQWGMRGRQIRRRSLLTTAGAAGMNAALIAACGGNKQEGSGNGGAVQDATVISTTPVAGQQGTPKPGGTLSLRANGNAPLDPYANSTFLAQTLASYTMARLMRFKTDLDPALSSRFEIEPDLAQTLETLPDGLTWTLHRDVQQGLD